jgi:hypothetical protein
MSRFVRKTGMKAESYSIEPVGRFLWSVTSALDMSLLVNYVGSFQDGVVVVIILVVLG